MTQDAQTWDEDRPIYRQLMEQIVARIIDQTYREGELLPSVRQIASDYLVNPLTVARAYRELGDLTETRRGIGLVVKEGVRDLLLRREQKRFLRDEWPLIRERIKALDLDPEVQFRGVPARHVGFGSSNAIGSLELVIHSAAW